LIPGVTISPEIFCAVQDDKDVAKNWSLWFVSALQAGLEQLLSGFAAEICCR
jgi:hypothetical protein